MQLVKKRTRLYPANCKYLSYGRRIRFFHNENVQVSPNKLLQRKSNEVRFSNSGQDVNSMHDVEFYNKLFAFLLEGESVNPLEDSHSRVKDE